MSTYNSQQPTSSIPSQSSYPPQYSQYNNPNQQFQNNRQQQGNYPYPPQQYPAQGQYPPQYPPQGGYQQQGYPVQNPYQNFSQRNAQYDIQDQQYAQNPNPNPQPFITPPPTIIPQNSPLLRHSLSQIVSAITKNLTEFSPQFQKKFTDNQSFKSTNNTMIYLPSALIMGHLFLNRNKKWFRLTVNARLIRLSLLGLVGLHFSTNVLYVAAYRNLIATNRDLIQKIIVREELLSGSVNK